MKINQVVVLYLNDDHVRRSPAPPIVSPCKDFPLPGSEERKVFSCTSVRRRSFPVNLIVPKTSRSSPWSLVSAS
jgi:hypothetical protein